MNNPFKILGFISPHVNACLGIFHFHSMLGRILCNSRRLECNEGCCVGDDWRLSFIVLVVAESLLQKCEVTFSDSVMRIVKPSSTDPCAPSISEPVSVQLTGIPPGTKEDILTMYLEHKRNGGGTIRSLQYNELGGMAVVSFEDDSSKI